MRYKEEIIKSVAKSIFSLIDFDYDSENDIYELIIKNGPTINISFDDNKVRIGDGGYLKKKFNFPDSIVDKKYLENSSTGEYMFEYTPCIGEFLLVVDESEFDNAIDFYIRNYFLLHTQKYASYTVNLYRKKTLDYNSNKN